jgi:hypothetical protein
MWLTYSGNKEDIWISRIPIPIRYKIDGPVNDTFDNLEVGGRIPDWNIYRPRWAQVGVVAFPSAKNKSLQLEDKDPYDYAKAVRVFAEAKSIHITCKVFARQSSGRLELEVLDGAGHRPVRVAFGEGGLVLKPASWHKIEIAADGNSGKYDLVIDGKPVARRAAFAEPASTLERLSFRTGEFRTKPDRGTDRYAGGDLPNPGEPGPNAVYNIDDVMIR